MLVLDEPANGLDPDGIRWLREFLRGLAGDEHGHLRVVTPVPAQAAVVPSTRAAAVTVTGRDTLPIQGMSRADIATVTAAAGVPITEISARVRTLEPRAVNLDGSLKSGEDWHAVGVTVRTGASVGTRAVCVAPVVVGRWALVAAGAVVTRDVPDHALVVGVPARWVAWVGRRANVSCRTSQNGGGAPPRASCTSNVTGAGTRHRRLMNGTTRRRHAGGGPAARGEVTGPTPVSPTSTTAGQLPGTDPRVRLLLCVRRRPTPPSPRRAAPWTSTSTCSGRLRTTWPTVAGPARPSRCCGCSATRTSSRAGGSSGWTTGCHEHRVGRDAAGAVPVSVSVGALFVPATGGRRDVSDVLRAADALMYAAETHGRGQVRFDEHQGPGDGASEAGPGAGTADRDGDR